MVSWLNPNCPHFSYASLNLKFLTLGMALKTCVLPGWLPENSALHGGKPVPAKPTLRMDSGEGVHALGRQPANTGDGLGAFHQELVDLSKQNGFV